ncbi:MAG: amidohydrolase family protein [Dehalococcoidia bacterium]|nr:amidohydrolase family protein [Dehalococcoidia bacterium]
MIIDAHTHIFSPKQIKSRKFLIKNDTTFGSIYSNDNALLASGDDLLTSMSKSKVDLSIIMGFQWSQENQYDIHAQYLLDQQSKFPEKFISFVPLSINSFNDISSKVRDMHLAGARGFGEIRINKEINSKSFINEILPELIRSVSKYNLLINFHTTEPIGHAYPGKLGGLSLRDMWSILSDFRLQKLYIIASHFGAGLPMYSAMPEVLKRLNSQNIYFDTSAFQFLYDNVALENAVKFLGHSKFIWGSDYPLIDQTKDLEFFSNINLDRREQNAILGGNLAHILGLS